MTAASVERPWGLAFLESCVVDKRLGLENLRVERVDVLWGSLPTGVIGFFVVVACAATLHEEDTSASSASDAAAALEPLAGHLASALFALGLLGAGLLAGAILPLSTGVGTAHISGGRFHFIDVPKGQSTPVARLSLPAGAYWVSGKVVAELYDGGQTSAAVVCSVRLGRGGNSGAAELEDEGIARIARPLDIQDTLSVSDVINLDAPGAIVLTCNSAVTGTDSGDPHVALATRVRLLAVPLDSIDVQPGLGPVP